MDKMVARGRLSIRLQEASKLSKEWGEGQHVPPSSAHSGETGHRIRFKQATSREAPLNKINLRLIEGEELVALILKYHEQINSKYKGLLPLKQVYVPETLEEEVL
jgi:hypothetical protein